MSGTHHNIFLGEPQCGSFIRQCVGLRLAGASSGQLFPSLFQVTKRNSSGRKNLGLDKF
jgi:hypothetical protein